MPSVTLTDISLKDHQLSARVAALRDAYFRALPEVCVERPCLVTEFSRVNGYFGKPNLSSLDKAKLYRHVIESRTPIVRHRHAVDSGMKAFDLQDRSLFAGSTTSKFKGVPLYPEFLALTLWPELQTVARRPRNPYAITEQEIRRLNETVFPYWLDSTIMELARQRLYRLHEQDSGKPGQAPEMKLLERQVFFLASKPNCISHTIPDFSRAINEGLGAIAAQAIERARSATDPKVVDFYQSVNEVVQGIIAYSRRLASEARRLAALSTDPGDQGELLAIAEIHDRVPEHPARKFREALTTIWTCWTAIHLENANVGLSLGRLDQVLYGHYQRDMAAGVLDLDQAIELVSCLWLKIGDHVPMIPEAGEQLFGGTGSNQAITIGGVDQQGNDAVNDLTYVILRSVELLRLRDPNLNARYFPGVNAPAYLRRLCEANINTGATPALHNDRAVIRALTSRGESLEQARDYGVIGCVEPGSNGRFYYHSGAIMMNLTSVLELALYNGEHRNTGRSHLISRRTGDASSFQSFEQFQQAFAQQAEWLIEQSTRLNNVLGETHQSHYPTPILSTLFEGPMERGKDLVFGGATLNASGVTFIGFADVVDSLAAIEQTVWKERSLTLPQLIVALDADFNGYEVLRTRLVNPQRTPKYGNENPFADRIALWLAGLLDRLTTERINYRNGYYRPGYWTMTNHAGFGRLMQATPNGRRSGENFTSGMTPVSGVTPELSKVLNSIASLPSQLMSNGLAVNLKYTPNHDAPDALLDRFVASVEAYFDTMGERRNGGMEVQFNVTNHDTFVDAMAHPANYPELLVRVSGYTAYFKDLNPQMQREILERTEYQLFSGQAVTFPPSSNG